MSAPNFYNKNASRIFAVEETDEDSENWSDAMGNIACDLKGYKNIQESDNGRDYPGTRFLEKTMRFWGVWTITVFAVVGGAYYNGSNFDWEIEIIKETKDDYQEGEPEDFKLPATIQNAIHRETKKIEKVYSEYTTPLICLGVFSNGEAVYEKAKN